MGNRTTACCIAFGNSSECFIGDLARKQANRDNPNFVFNIKKMLGKKYSEISFDRPFTIVRKKGDIPLISVAYQGQKKEYSSVELCSMLLFKIKANAESYLKASISSAVLSVPTYFGEAERSALVEASRIAGINVKALIEEPIAAAIAYGLDKQNYPSRKIALVFHWGGSTFQASLLGISNSGDLCVIGTVTDEFLGGDAIDAKLLEYFSRKIKDERGVDIVNSTSVRRLRFACEYAKKSLQFKQTTEIEIDDLVKDYDCYQQLTRGQFDLINQELFKKCYKHIEHLLHETKVEKKNVDAIILSGGTSRLITAQDLHVFFGSKCEVLDTINPEEVIAHGVTVVSRYSDEKNEGERANVNQNIMSFRTDRPSVFGKYRKVIKIILRVIILISVLLSCYLFSR